MIKKRKILFLTYRFPYPLIGGDRLKSFQLLKHLGKHHEVHLVSFCWNEPPKPEHVKIIEDSGVNVTAVPITNIGGGWNSLKRIFQKYPLEISFFMDKRFRQIVNNIIEKKDIDIAFAFFMRTAEFLIDKPIKKVLIAEDCRTHFQYRSFKTSRNLKQKLVRAWEVYKLRRYEPQLVEKFDKVTLVSQDDIDFMKEANPYANYDFLTNGTDTDFFTPNENFDSRKDILFAGKLNVWSNVMSSRILAEQIFPVIQKKLPGTKLKIVGASPTTQVRNLQSDNIEVIANVPDLRPYLQQGRVFVHSHFGGSGIQNKVLEAMASGIPVVTTPIGNQGIEAKQLEEVMIGKSIEELAAHVLRILEDDDLARKISENARQLMIKNHSWQSIFDKMDKIIDEICE